MYVILFCNWRYLYNNINNELVNKINNVSSTLIQKIIDNVENIMQLTHKFRMYENDNNVSLETEFNSFFKTFRIKFRKINYI